jgi:hypothetical protein
MEPIGKLLNQPASLALRSNVSTTTELSLCEPSELPQWAEVLMQLAQDKRHDLAPGILRFWMEKLQNYTDVEICKGLLLYAGEYFPSVDVIIDHVERGRKATAAEATERRQDIYWAEFERNNRDIERFKAEHGGKTPQQVWCEENREFLSKIGRREASADGQATVGAMGVDSEAPARAKGTEEQQGDVGNHEIVSTGKSGNERTGVSGDGE